MAVPERNQGKFQATKIRQQLTTIDLDLYFD